MSELKKGDYVLATKWSDGDPEDPWYVGFFVKLTGVQGEGGRFIVDDGKGVSPRQTGFRRAEKISKRVGSVLLRNACFITKSGRSVWFWRRNIRSLEALEACEK